MLVLNISDLQNKSELDCASKVLYPWKCTICIFHTKSEFKKCINQLKLGQIKWKFVLKFRTWHKLVKILAKEILE